MIEINGYKLATAEDALDLFDADHSFSGQYHIKPIYSYLPDFTNMEEEEKKEYVFKDVPEGSYLVGLEVISDQWVNKGFCNTLFRSYGLILDESYPLAMRASRHDTEASMVFLSFRHPLN